MTDTMQTKRKPITSTCFVIMSFREATKRVYEDWVKPALVESGFRISHVADLLSPGNIIKDIVGNIAGADLVIADLTGRNPNVFYELAVAHTLGIPCILLAKQGTRIPFDLKPYRVIPYEDSSSGARKLYSSRKATISEWESAQLSNPILDTIQSGTFSGGTLRVTAIGWQMPHDSLSIYVAGNYGRSLCRVFPQELAKNIRDRAADFIESILPTGSFHVTWRERPTVGMFEVEYGNQGLDWWPLGPVFRRDLQKYTVKLEVSDEPSVAKLYIELPDTSDERRLPPALRKSFQTTWFTRMTMARKRLDQLRYAMFGQRVRTMKLEAAPTLGDKMPKYLEMKWHWD